MSNWTTDPIYAGLRWTYAISTLIHLCVCISVPSQLSVGLRRAAIQAMSEKTSYAERLRHFLDKTFILGIYKDELYIWLEYAKVL